MPNDGVTIDTSELDAYASRLAADLAAGGDRVAREAADRVAGDIARAVPHLTGRLAASVAVTQEPGGYGVSYGEGVPYARKIERRDGTVADAVESGAGTFPVAVESMAKKEAKP
jgi:hypothetical protein